MSADQSVLFLVQVGMEDADAAELDMLTRQLIEELLELDVETAAPAVSGALPAGAKAGDPITIGTIAVTVLPAILPKIIEFCQAWALRGQGRTIKFKGKISGQDIEFEGSATDFKNILIFLNPPSLAGSE